jgi:hypothetical protein
MILLDLPCESGRDVARRNGPVAAWHACALLLTEQECYIGTARPQEPGYTSLLCNVCQSSDAPASMLCVALPHSHGCAGGTVRGSSGGHTNALLHLPPGGHIVTHEHHTLFPIDETLLGLRADVARTGPAMAWPLVVLARVVLPGEYRPVAAGRTLSMAEL